MAGLSFGGLGADRNYMQGGSLPYSMAAPAPMVPLTPAPSIGAYNSLGASDPVGAAMSTQATGAPVQAQSGPASLMGTDGLNLGWNMGTARLALGGLQTFGNLLMANKAHSLAKQQFAFQRETTDTNINNQIQSYNTALSDRANQRAWADNRGQAEADAYVEANRMRRG